VVELRTSCWLEGSNSGATSTAGSVVWKIDVTAAERNKKPKNAMTEKLMDFFETSHLTRGVVIAVR